MPNSDYRKAQLAFFDLVEEPHKKLLDDIMSAWRNLNDLNSEGYFMDFAQELKLYLKYLIMMMNNQTNQWLAGRHFLFSELNSKSLMH